MKAVAVSGSPRSPSKSKALAEALLAELAALGCETQMIDVATLPAAPLLARETSPEIDAAIAAVGEAAIVIAATPTYRALYTGALKCFFDLMPQAHLAGKLCIGLQTGLAPQHSLSPEYGLRPLFASLEGLPYATLYATDPEFTDGLPNPDLTTRLKNLASQASSAATNH